MIRRIICSIGTAASIISLAFIQEIHIGIRVVIALVGIASAAVLLWNDITANQANERVCHSEEEIKATMKALIKTQGKVCIVSRDLSWVDSEIEACIKDKKSSITIFAQYETELTQRLEKGGAIIRYYGALKFEPQMRFTVIGYNRPNPQVAIANTQHTIRKNGRFEHIIYETSGNSPLDRGLASLAVDMITLCGLVSQEGRKGEAKVAQNTT